MSALVCIRASVHIIHAKQKAAQVGSEAGERVFWCSRSLNNTAVLPTGEFLLGKFKSGRVLSPSCVLSCQILNKQVIHESDLMTKRNKVNVFNDMKLKMQSFLFHQGKIGGRFRWYYCCFCEVINDREQLEQQQQQNSRQIPRARM